MSTNSSVGGRSWGKEATLDDVVNRIAAMEETVRPLVPLADQFAHLETTVTDQGRDQTALHVALTRIEAVIRDLGRANGNQQGRRQGLSTDEDEPRDDFVPTTHELEFPKYDGASNPLPWLNRCEQYFRVRRTPDHKRVAYATFHLLEDAQLWFHWLELNGGQPDWPHFVKMVNAHFGPPLMDSLIGELAQLRRTGTVDEYCNKFMSLSCRDTMRTEPQQIQLFITGLGNPLRTNVALMQLATLADAVVFTRAYEHRHHHSVSAPDVHPLRHVTDNYTSCVSGKLGHLVTDNRSQTDNNPATLAGGNRRTTPHRNMFPL
jgi:hypothetical protein